ncbi:cytochrome P450 [Sciscionella marina]|uniref:cytochrome P450 n=1 Tax=Sciscionella marina TaxID=508770 RepID=UPI0003770EE6|nr:cytochrome P450 [Sciscionella marina]
MITSVYDPLDESFQLDPYPAYRRLRQDEPVHYHEPVPAHGEPGFWALSRFEDIWQAVRDHGTFSSASGLTYHHDEIAKLGLAPTMVMMDPPQHRRLRALISKAFTPRRVAMLEDRLRAFVRTRLTVLESKAADGATPNLHVDFSSPLPSFVVAHLLGVPQQERDRFDPWVSAIVSLTQGGLRADQMSGNDAVQQMFEYFGRLITIRRTEPGEDLISALIAAEIDGDHLSDWDILGFCFNIVAGGNDTTSNLISHGVVLLDRFPRQRDMLLTNRDIIPNALVEFLRMESSVQALARTTTRPVKICGTEIPEGEKVMMLYGSGNHDEREFGDTAEELDITRDIPRHLGFSNGVHFCIGSHLAWLQARVAYEELLAAHPNIGVDLDHAQRLRSAFTRGWHSLPAVNLTTGAATGS